MHTTNQNTAAGTALAISYQSYLADVTLENLVVFFVLYKTPWKRIAVYEVSEGLQECPPEGCSCASLWVPFGCGTPNEYMAGYKCEVPGATSTVPLGTAKPATF